MQHPRFCRRVLRSPSVGAAGLAVKAITCLTSAWIVHAILSAHALHASESPAWHQTLQAAVLSEGQALAEVHRYLAARLPVMPAATSASQWQAEAEGLRQEVLARIVYRGKAVQWRDAPTRVEWLDTIPGGPGYHIRKLRYEALPGMWIPALLYEPEQLSGKVPAILNVNGHSEEGKVYVPKQMRCINQAKRGMLALNLEWLGMGQLRTPGFHHGSMNQLDLCGTSGLAPFYLAMKRGLDILLDLEHADPDRVAVTGLSGGGWQTIVISALDTRVRLAVPVAGYSSFRTRTEHLKDLGDSEQTPSDLATLVDYTHLTAMMAPRPTLLTYNAKDECCFEASYALQPLLDAAQPAFTLHGAAGSLRSHVNNDPGTHNYERDNREALYKMLGAFFFAGDPDFNTSEIPSDGEVKTKDELSVPLPENNEDFNSLATQLATGLPHRPEVPADTDGVARWQRAARTGLGQLVRKKDYEVQSRQIASATFPELAASSWTLEMDGQWHVPATILEPPRPRATVLLIADTGRQASGDITARLLRAEKRVIAVDPFGFGESAPGEGQQRAQHASLFALLLAAVGDRPLGIQASQVMAAARWSADRWRDGPVSLVAVGPRTSTIALIAAALEPDAIGQLEMYGSLRSLKQVISENWSAAEKPELFCFGLLEQFDIEQLRALVAPRAVTCIDPGS